jgi:hypothetical protein
MYIYFVVKIDVLIINVKQNNHQLIIRVFFLLLRVNQLILISIYNESFECVYS